MDRPLTYVGSQVYEWVDSAAAQFAMTALAKLTSAMFGTSTTVNGLAAAPTSPATMAINIGPGEIYQLAQLEATVAGTLPADTTHQIMKQGVQLNTVTTATFTPPGTSGQSINYLIEAQYQDQDVSIDPTTGNSPVVIQFYNAANPATPWSGPNNSGSSSNTFRKGVVALQVKAGTPATTGSQATPAPDSGWVGVWVVTVAFGQSTVVAGNISQYVAAPILPTALLPSVISGNLTFGTDNGSANVVQATFPIPITSLTDNMELWVKVKANNSGATTFTPNLGVIAAAPVVGAAHAALQGGELVASGRALFVYRADITSWVLAECTGGAQQVAQATASSQAVQFGQVSGVAGQVRNLVLNQTAAAATATVTADEIIVETALGGLRYCLANFNKSVNLATTGAGGMDTGSAPVSGFVGLYAIYGTAGTALLAVNATSSALPTIYGGANMPAGYTASALIAVVPTNASSQIVACVVQDRDVTIGSVTALSTATPQSSFTSLSLPIPPNAKNVSLNTNTTSTSAGAIAVWQIATTSNALGGVVSQIPTATGYAASNSIIRLMVSVAKTVYYIATVSAGTPAFQLNITGYTF
ncbi:hypothetical protein HNQ50_000321 [Silvimonas terrae]|uniref:Uncharacterized protein n=1 Tax=Silvimonas terrae TaxID=300266 RepID=A0A840RBD4_9NEIS|nr:hypothetical protein [Silvimonas terrae]MBB5189611.1 hypothetical protein [Silvimonas terrae]